MIAEREQWLHGWPFIGPSILIGTGVYCAGCGRDEGVTTVAIPDDWTPPGPTPDWPFSEEHCPVCWLRRKAGQL